MLAQSIGMTTKSDKCFQIKDPVILETVNELNFLSKFAGLTATCDGLTSNPNVAKTGISSGLIWDGDTWLVCGVSLMRCANATHEKYIAGNVQNASFDFTQTENVEATATRQQTGRKVITSAA